MNGAPPTLEQQKPKFLTVKDNPRFTTEEAERIEKALQPHGVVIVASPNYMPYDAKMRAMPYLRNGLAMAFGDAAIAADEASPSGFVAKVDGSLRLNNEERLAMLLGGHKAGLGTSVYAVEGPLVFDTEEKIRATIKDNHDLPQLIAPWHAVSLERTQDENGNNLFAIFVTANDVAAARALGKWVRSHQNGMELDDVVTSPQYAHMLRAAQCKRDVIAAQYAAALGLQLKGKAPTHTTMHFSIVAQQSLAHGMHQSFVPPTGAKPEEMYVVYNNAANTAGAYGGVLLAHGTQEGHTLLESASPKHEGQLKNTKEWHQSNFLSHMPADSVRFNEQSEVAARHRNGGDKASREAFDSRVAWRSDLGDRLHPLADDKYNAVTDRFTKAWLERFNPPEEPPLHHTQFKTVTAQLPDMPTQYLSTPQLAELAVLEETPNSLPVDVESDLVASIPRKWNKIREPYQKVLDDLNRGGAAAAARARKTRAVKLATIFDNAYENDNADEIQMLRSGANAFCAIPGHDHANSAALSAPHTLINLDKRLIVLLTKK